MTVRISGQSGKTCLLMPAIATNKPLYRSPCTGAFGCWQVVHRPESFTWNMRVVQTIAVRLAHCPCSQMPCPVQAEGRSLSKLYLPDFCGAFGHFPLPVLKGLWSPLGIVCDKLPRHLKTALAVQGLFVLTGIALLRAAESCFKECQIAQTEGFLPELLGLCCLPVSRRMFRKDVLYLAVFIADVMRPSRKVLFQDKKKESNNVSVFSVRQDE